MGSKCNSELIFETWHIPDGNYPPLHKGQSVKLSFELEFYALSKAPVPAESKFEQIKDAEYRFAGKVLKVYDQSSETPIVVVEAGDMRFYISSFPSGSTSLKEGDFCLGHESSMLDHYLWVEFLNTYEDALDLFYAFRVTRIRSVKIPEKFVSHYERGMSGPASLRPEYYSAADIADLEDMGQHDRAWSFYLVDLESSSVDPTAIP